MSDTIEEPEVAETIPAEDVLANMEAQLREAEATAASERQRAADAEARAAQAGQAVVAAHTVTLDSAETAQKSRLEQARASYRAAREAGDVDAEQRAIEESADARAELSHIAFQKTQAARQPQQTQSTAVRSPQAERWLHEHPKWATDLNYQRDCADIHDIAVKKKIVIDSPAYFAFADRALTALHGPDHGKDVPVKQPNGAGVRRPVASSTAAAPSRAGVSNGRTGTDLNALVAKLNQIVEGEEPITVADFISHAEATYPRLDKDEAVKKYAAAQESILGSRSRTTSTGNGAIYRI